MAGILGYSVNADREPPGDLLESMARALEPAERFKQALYQNGHVGLGRVSLGIINPGPQPVWNAAGDICLVVEGELYDTGALRADLLQKGYQFDRDDDPELLLHLYEELGVDFFGELNGLFALALWDQRAGRLLVATDRIGQYPLYYALREDGLYFASGVRALLPVASVPRQVDPVGVAQFLTFNHLLEDTTLLDAVKRLPPAARLSYQHGELEISEYWRMDHPEGYELRSEHDWMDELEHHLQGAVARQSSQEHPLGLLLSGGLDSRVILAYLRDEIGPERFTTFTWGAPGCDDHVFASQVSKIHGVPHRFYELKPDWLIQLADECVRITDGMGNVVCQHAFANIEEQARVAPIIYKGFMGDGMLGFSLRQQHWAAYDPQTRLDAHLQVHHDQGAILFKQVKLRELFSSDFERQVGDGPIDAYRTGLDYSDSALIADQRNVYGLRQRVPRMALCGVEVVRDHAFVRLPFCDKELVDFSLRVPPGLRYDRRLIKNTFIRRYPKLAQVPYTQTGLPLMECLRDVLIRAENVLRWHLNKAGLKRVAYPHKRPYQDYDHWMRTVLRPWVEATLLDDRALSRGHFKPEKVRQLVDEHMNGANHATRLGVLISIELWQRMFLD